MKGEVGSKAFTVVVILELEEKQAFLLSSKNIQMDSEDWPLSKLLSE